ncbi:MAG: STAS domain-containing protein, partial [Bryobacterales bacterium]
ITIIDCFGRFDEVDTNQFIQLLEQLQNQGNQHLILNLSHLYYLDPKVVNLLFFGHEFLQTHSGTFSLISPLSSVRDELFRGKIPNIIPTFENMYDAMHRPHCAYQGC